MATGPTPSGDIGEVAINPGVETHTNGQANLAAQAEENFFTESGELYRLQHNGQNLGWLGKFFGSNSTAPTNIAGFVIICSLLLLLISLFLTANPELADTRKFLGSVILSALSFIFGASSRK